ncbi:MAG: protease inhibitor I42 family protein [Stellaceae bacterium]
MIYIDESFLDQTVRLPVGQVMELRLKENPTTGFRWSFAADSAPSCTVLCDVFVPRGNPPGAGGEHTWQIKAVREGTCDLRLVYRRSFEPSAEAAQSFTLHVQVTE